MKTETKSEIQLRIKTLNGVIVRVKAERDLAYKKKDDLLEDLKAAHDNEDALGDKIEEYEDKLERRDREIEKLQTESEADYAKLETQRKENRDLTQTLKVIRSQALVQLDIINNKIGHEAL